MTGFIPRKDRPRATLFSTNEYAAQRGFFAAHPELAPTPLRRFRALSRSLGVGEIHGKDETARFGLNAFKAAGAMFAIAALKERGDLQRGETLVCASEGNHGRAVARAARDNGCAARVYMAESAASSRITAIEAEGATVVRVRGTYDDAVRSMAADAEADGWRVISDTALDGQPDDVPRLIMLGYTRLMDEAEAQWRPGPAPDVIFVPGGVGGLLAAVADWTRASFSQARPAVVCVEPKTACCLQASAREGRPTTLEGPFETTMAGLRCGEVSRAGFDAVLSGVDAYVAIEDAWAFEAMRQLASGEDGDPMVRAGASGAAATGGLLAALRDRELVALRDHLRLGPESRVLVLITEGVTDPQLFAEVVGGPTTGHRQAVAREP